MRIRVLTFLMMLGSLTLQAQQAYFQQDVHYKINVELFPETKMLKGVQHFKYTNNSPTPLEYIWFHMYPNAFKDESTPFAKQMKEMRRWPFTESNPEDKGWIEADFIHDGKKLTADYKSDAIDEVKVILPKALRPGESIELEIPFEVKIPKMFSRLGFSERNFSISQWYPKVVVFDKYGWHPDSYLDFGEFYGEFGTFDVTFTLPKSYVMDATGLLDNEPEEQKFMDDLSAEYQRYLTMSNDQRSEYRKNLKEERKKTFKADEKKTISFHAENVQDFAMFCSENYSVDKKVSADGVVSYALIQPENLDGWKDAAKFALDAVHYYGKWVGKYPHPKASVADGALDAGGGMEYPMITVIDMSDVPGLILVDQVVTHEVGHNWFQGILGSNERANAWLDEGLNSYYEVKTLEEKYGADRSFISAPDSIPVFGLILREMGIRELDRVSCNLNVWKGIDLPNNLPAVEYAKLGNATVLYHKTAMTMLSLRWYLGEEKFNRMMQSYFEKWKFKHPYPEDFYKNANESTGEDLTWFFEQFINTTKVNDFVITNAETKQISSGYETSVTVKNNGDMIMPAPVFLTMEDGSVIETRWDPRQSETVTIQHSKPIKELGVNTNYDVHELNYRNNKTSRSFPVKFLVGIPSLNQNDIFLFPVIGYEGYKDKFQTGLGFWSGHPLLGPDFWFGTVYYAANSNTVGYRNNFRYRFPRMIFNYSDFGYNLYDQEGFSKQELYFRTKYETESYFAFAEIGAGHYKNYDMIYMNQNLYQQSEYTTFDLSLKSSYLTRGLVSKTNIHVSQGIEVLNGNFNFTRVDLETKNTFRYASDRRIMHRMYTGFANGNLPLQEAFFAGGSPDPRRNDMFMFRRGDFSILDNLSSGGGMGLLGYAVSDTTIAGKSGLSHRLAFEFRDVSMTLFADAGSVGSTYSEVFKNQWLFDAGFGYTTAAFSLYFPLWVSKPMNGENNVEFRFLAELNLIPLFFDILD